MPSRGAQALWTAAQASLEERLKLGSATAKAFPGPKHTSQTLQRRTMLHSTVIQRAWGFTEGVNSKNEFDRRVSAGPAFLVELAALTGRKAGNYDVIDINDIANSVYATLGRSMRTALGTAGIRPDTPYHCNCNNDYPSYGSDWGYDRFPYVEFNYFAGGARLVVDRIQEVVYFSSHYRTPYVLQDGATAPAAIIQKAKAQYNTDVAADAIMSKKNWKAQCTRLCGA